MERKSLKAMSLIELLVIVAIISVLAALIIPFVAKARQKALAPAQSIVQEVKKLDPHDQGENVYYFPFTNNEFRKSLVEFLKKNPAFEVVAMTPDVDKEGSNQYSYGKTTGHTVVFRQK